jgi:uncharacterized protein (DUF1501 family)
VTNGPRISRRHFIGGGLALAAMHSLPITGLIGKEFAATAADPDTALRNRLVVIRLGGGNDGLNTVIPRGDVAGSPRLSVYRQARPTLRYEPDQVLPLARSGDAAHQLGLHPSLQRIHGMYQAGRVAIVQGVDYPDHSFSHFVGTDKWESGQPDTAPDSGWLGRHLDRTGIGAGELRGVAISTELPLVLRGRDKQGVNIPGIPLAFADGTDALGDARHAALSLFGQYPATEPLRAFSGATRAETVALVEQLEGAPTPASLPNNPLANALLTARVLLEGSFGLECVSVSLPGFDTHTGERTLHERLMATLDAAIATFFDGDPATGVPAMAPAVASRTIVMTTSEFGRRLAENGASGTDHGTSAPVFMVGPPNGRLVPGVHGEHPDLGTTQLPADNLPMTTDLRTVYQALLQEWLGDPDPAYATPLPGLFLP